MDTLFVYIAKSNTQVKKMSSPLLLLILYNCEKLKTNFSPILYLSSKLWMKWRGRARKTKSMPSTTSFRGILVWKTQASEKWSLEKARQHLFVCG